LAANTHPATTRGRLSSILCAAALAVATAGCGLSHYQQQMAEEQARLARLDEEKTKLDDPLQLPDKKGRPSYFFRPPKGIMSTGVPHESNVLQRFGLRTNNPSYFQDVAFGVENMDEKDFWSSLLRSFPDKKKPDEPNFFLNPAGRDKLAFRELKSGDGSVFVYVWSRGGSHAAVVFRLTRANDPTARELMDISLGTLTVGSDAGRLYRAHQEWKKQEQKEAARKAAAQQDQ
jgi:hypothetical protein